MALNYIKNAINSINKAKNREMEEWAVNGHPQPFYIKNAQTSGFTNIYVQ